jgi:hypothetical protein
LGLGIVAHFTGAMDAAFWFVAASMFVSGALLWWFGEETHPRLNPQSVDGLPGAAAADDIRRGTP